jgi:hypothetical protein
VALFTTGQVVTAAQLNALNGYVAKTADQSVTSSTTLVNDTHLFQAVAAGTHVVDCYLFGTSGADSAGDVKFAFSFPGTMTWYGDGPDTALATAATQTTQFFAYASATSGTSTIGYGLSASVLGIHLHGLLTATTAGTLRLMWAQFASNANASTLKAGSHMTVRQVA